jgi:hypothetical protein
MLHAVMAKIQNIVLMMEAASTNKTSVNFHHITRATT